MDPSLLQPSLANAPARSLPWRTGSVFWIAFFGGVVPTTVILWLNAQRLGASVQRQRMLLLIGAAGLAAYLGIAIWAASTWDPTLAVAAARSSRTLIRTLSRGLFVVVYLAQAAILREDDRRYAVFGGDHASLWVPGLAATILLGGVQSALFLGLVLGLR